MDGSHKYNCKVANESSHFVNVQLKFCHLEKTKTGDLTMVNSDKKKNKLLMHLNQEEMSIRFMKNKRIY